jgi:hypothetical protein
VDVPTLILLGAAGGVLRAVLDFYIQFVNWRSARGAHLREQLPEPEKPRFRQYFDPAVDLTAAGVHSGMGAGLAVLFGSTGQISGPYAAIVVGVSAPVMLTQLARVHAVSDALGGGQQTAGTSAGAADPVQQAVPAAPAQPTFAEPGSGMPGGAPVTALSGPVPPSVSSTALGPEAAAAEPRPASTHSRAEALQADAGERLPRQSDGEAESRQASSQMRSAGFRPGGDTVQPQPNGRPTDSTAAPGRGGTDRGTPPLRGEPAVGEEGLT